MKLLHALHSHIGRRIGAPDGSGGDAKRAHARGAEQEQDGLWQENASI